MLLTRPGPNAHYTILLAALVISLPIHFEGYGMALTVADAILPVAMLVAFFSLVTTLRQGFGVCCIGYLLLVGASAAANALSPAFAADFFWIQTLKNVVSLAYFAVFIALARRAGDIWLDVLVLVGSMVSLIALTRVFVLHLEPRAYFPFLNPNAFAAFLALPFFLAFSRTLTSRRNWVSLGSLFLIVLGILATGSRGGIGGIVLGIVSALALVWYKRGLTGRVGRRVTFVAALSALAVIAVVSANLIDPSTTALERLSDSDRFEAASSLRLAYWQLALDLFKQNPIFGIGLGQFPVFSGILGEAHVTHNTYLSFAVELGIVGLLAWLALLAGLWLRVISAPRLTPVTMAMAGYVVAAAIQAGLNNTENLRVVWLGLAIIIAHPHFFRKSTRRAPDAVPIPSQRHVVKR